MHFDSDHRMLRATVRLCVPKKSRKNFKSTPYGFLNQEDVNAYIDNLRSYEIDKK